MRQAMNGKARARPIAIAAIVLVVVVIRLPAMLQSVEGTDEGLYALVAREWLEGHLPYTTVWEAKPPFFFAILAAAMALFGQTMIAVRIAIDVAIASGAVALYAIGTTLRRDGEAIGFTAACFYAAMTISDSGQSAVAESFYVPFIAVAFAVALRPAPVERVRLLLLAGLGASLAGAVLIKESAAIEAAYAGIVLVCRSGIAAVVPVGAGFAAMLAAAIAPYASTGRFAEFWDANVATLERRAPVAVPDVAPPLAIVRAQLLAFFPATLLVPGLPLLRIWNDDDARDVRRMVFVMIGWFLANLATVVSIREYLGNHFVGAMAPASLLGAIVAVRAARRLRSRWVLPAAIALALVAHAGYQFVLAAPVVLDRLRSGDPAYGDPSAELAAYLLAHRAPNERLYVADDRTVLYVLAQAEPPTRFAYPAHLLDRYQQIIAGVDGPVEIARILAMQPAYIVRDLANVPNEDPRGAALLNAALRERYHRVFTVGQRTIYAHDGVE